MIPVLAESVNPPEMLGPWLSCLMYLALIIAAVVHAWKSIQPEPSIEDQIEKIRHEVALAFAAKEKQLTELRDHVYENFASKDEVARAVEVVGRAVTQDRTTTERFRTELRNDIHKLFDLASGLSGQISFLDGRTRRSE